MTGSFKSRLARGQRRDGRTFSPSSIQAATPVDAAHPTVRTRPRRLSLSFLFVGSAASATFLPFHPPPTPVWNWTPPKNAATPSHFLPRLHLPSLLLDTFEHAGRGRKGTKQQAAPGSPLPSSPPIDADRGRLLTGDADRSPGGAASVRSSPSSSWSWLFLPVAWRRVGRPVGG